MHRLDCYNITKNESSRGTAQAHRLLIGSGQGALPSSDHVESTLARPALPVDRHRRHRGRCRCSQFSRPGGCARAGGRGFVHGALGDRAVHLAGLQLLPAGGCLPRQAARAPRYRGPVVSRRLLGPYRLEGPFRLARDHAASAHLCPHPEAAPALYARDGGRRHRPRTRNRSWPDRHTTGPGAAEVADAGGAGACPSSRRLADRPPCPPSSSKRGRPPT